MTRRNLLMTFGAALFFLALVGLWQLVSHFRLVSPVFFPAPLRTAESLLQQVAEGTLWWPLLLTSARVLGGWTLALIVGVALGALIGLSARASAYLGPTLEFLRTLPASAVLPVFIMLMGLTPEMIVSVIAFGSVWPVLLASLHGFRHVEPRLLEVARTLKLGKAQTLAKILLPNAVPDILAGARVSIAFALILSVVAEMLTSQAGLGNNVLLASRAFRSADLYAGILVLGVVGAATTGLLALVERRLLRWRPAPAGS